MRPIDEAADRIRAARDAAKAAGIPLVINARIDLYLAQAGDPATRFAETVRRAKAYLAAGADCLFPFALTDTKLLAELAEAVKAPLNAVGRAGGPSLAEFERAGVARVSTAGGPALAALSLTRKVAEELRATGRFDMLKSTVTRAEVQALFAPRPE
jgi:2-methylisocitrate lyase-like PEP mutase family enzyme